MLHVSWPPVRGGEGRGYYVLRSNRSERERGAEIKYSGGLSQRERELRHPFGRCSPTAHWAAPLPSPATIARSTRQQETEREASNKLLQLSRLQFDVVSLHDRHQLIPRREATSLQATELELPIDKDLEGSCGEHTVPQIIQQEQDA
jgi:hypothetical protein